jgi:hypothetical protein
MINPTLIWRGTIDPNTNQTVADYAADCYIKDVVLAINGPGALTVGAAGQWFIQRTPSGGAAYVVRQGNIFAYETLIIHLDLPLDANDDLSIEYAAPAAAADLEVHVSGFTS